MQYLDVDTGAISGYGSTYLRLVGKVAQRAGDHSHEDEGEPGIARRPAEVLVAVGVNLYFQQCVST